MERMTRRPCPSLTPAILLILAAVLAAGCVTPHPHLSLPELALGEPSFFPTLEAYGTAPIVPGNAVRLLLNGEQIFPTMVEAIRSARRSISYAQYYYEEGPVAREMSEALAERCRSGVAVNVLLDAFGTLTMPAEYTELMRRSGCHVAYFRPLAQTVFRSANKRNHRRLLVVDGRVGFTGGSGVSRKWMGNGRTPGHWRDTDIRVEGPAVEYLQGAFAENWLETTGIVLGGEVYFPQPRQPRGSTYVQVVKSSPAGGAAALYTTFLLAISAAQRSIHITNPYFVVDDAMGAALVEAVRRGVRVSVLVPGVIDHNIVREASRGRFGRMLRAGVEIHEYEAGLLHAKTMVIDGVWSTVGSANLDNRSLALNEELNVIAYGESTGRELERVFAEDLQYARRLDYRAWRSRGLGSRVLELLAAPIRSLL
jgi:cardiolipin synthase